VKYVQIARSEKHFEFMPSATTKKSSPTGLKKANPPAKRLVKSVVKSVANSVLKSAVKKSSARDAQAVKIASPRRRATAAAADTGESPLFGADIGRRIRNLRHIKGLTLKDLADRTACSESMLSKVENGKAQVSLTLLHRVVHSLDITITALFSESQADQGVVTRAKDRSTFRIDANGSRLERLVPPNLGHLLEGNLHILAPGGGSDGILMHEGEEVGYVLSGTLELTVSGVQYLLHTGDSFVYRSEQPHSYRNPTKATTRVLWVSTPPTF
jgi:transcriptional regulator with XRE-family HTH domain